MTEVEFDVEGEQYTARIVANGLAGQHSVREIVDGAGEPLSGQLVSFPFTIKLLPDDDFAILPAGSLTRENSGLLMSLVSKLGEGAE